MKRLSGYSKVRLASVPYRTELRMRPVHPAYFPSFVMTMLTFRKTRPYAFVFLIGGLAFTLAACG